MAEAPKKFDPQSKSGELRTARIADAIRRKASSKIESRIQGGREKFQEAGRNAEGRLKDYGGNLARSASSRASSKVDGYSAKLNSLRQGNLQELDPHLEELNSKLDNFEKNNPEFSSYVRKQIDKAREDGDLKETAEGIKEDAKAAKDLLEGASFGRRLTIYADALKYGYQLAGKLDEQIAKGGSSWWILVLVMAVAKDLFDMLVTFMSLPPLPTALFLPVVDTAISFFFFAFFLRFLWGKGTFVFKIILRRIIPGMLFESIPYLEFIPFMTVTIIYAWWKSSKIQEQLIRARTDFGKNMGQLEKRKL